MSPYARSRLFLLLITVFTEYLAEGEGRREIDGGLNVQVELPKYPKVGEGVVLECKYNLGTDTLYTVKWYKGNGEFYRYTPKELPAIKIFKFPGLEVDERFSNATHVYLRHIDLSMSGKYSCEVTTDAPDFTTDLKTEHLTVVAVPNSKPELSRVKALYAVGDLVNVTCYASRSKPAANLTWFINTRPHMDTPLKLEKYRDRDNFESSSLTLIFVVRTFHFVNGRLSLRCTSTVYHRYSDWTEITVLEEVRPRISSVVENSSTQTQHQSRNQGRGLYLPSNPAMSLVFGGLVTCWSWIVW